MSNAWADLLDAQRRLAHGWVAEGLRPDEIADRLSADADQVQQLLTASSEPPPPGSSRDKLRLWQDRASDLEGELRIARHPSPTPERPPSGPPRASYVRALQHVHHQDPARCICQFWRDTKRPGEAHNALCLYDNGPQ